MSHVDAEHMERIEIERIPREEALAQSLYKIKQGRRWKEGRANTAAVRITVVSTDGTSITDVWTRDRFQAFFREATQVIADD